MVEQKPVKKKIPSFTRQNLRLKRVDAAWRKPRGIDNKLRIKRSGFGPLPRIGYRQPASIRGMHPSGKRESLVHNAAELAAAGKQSAIRIGATVGAKKRKQLVEKAKQLGLKVLNA